MVPPKVELVDKIGFGSMSLTVASSSLSLDEAVSILNYVTHRYKVRSINGGIFYGPDDKNLKVLKKFLESNEPSFNSNLVLCIKGAFNMVERQPEGNEEGVKKSVDKVLSFFPKNVGRPKLIFEAARVDPKVPYETTISAIALYVEKGLLDGVSVSEVGAHTIAKADNVFPISFVEVELSLISRDIIYNGVLRECSERNIPIIAYSPLHMAILTDHAVENSHSFLELLHENDFRRSFDRFSKDNFDASFNMVKELYDFAHERKMSLEGLAMSWILKLSGHENFNGIKKVCKIIPIPSGSTTTKIDKNFTSTIELSDKDFAEINNICDRHKVHGQRYNAHHTPLEFA